MKHDIYKVIGVSDSTREWAMHECVKGAERGSSEGKREVLRIYEEFLAEGKVPQSKLAHAYIVNACKRVALLGTPRGKRLHALRDGVNNREPAALAEAVSLLRDQANILPANRDQKRQRGTTKPRRPKIDQWIDQKLEHDPDAKSPELWKAVPDWISDQIAFDRFCKRVTQGRKRRK